MVTKQMLRYGKRASELEYLHCYRKFYDCLSRAKEELAFHRYNDCVSDLYDAMEFFWKALRHLESPNIRKSKHHLPQRDFWNQLMSKLASSVVSNQEQDTLTNLFDKYNPKWDINPKDRLDARYAQKGIDSARSWEQFNDIEGILAPMLSKFNRNILSSQSRLTVGILDGYFGLDRPNEKPCTIRTHAEYQDGGVQGWIDALATGGASPANISLLAVTDLSPKFAVVINPFGEDYPELPSASNVIPAYQAIRAYINAGGVFVTAGGHPFYYLFDVSDGRHHDTSITIPDITVGVATDAQGRLQIHKATIVPETLLSRDFGVATTMTLQAKHSSPFPVNGYQESEDREYWRCQTNTDQIHLFRSLIEHTRGKVTPVLRAILPGGEEVFPVAFVKYGSGILLHTGLDLNNDRKKEFDIATAAVRDGLVGNFERYFR